MDMTPASINSTSPLPPQSLSKHACTLCSRRKVKCNRKVPCSNCTKARADCVYELPVLHRTSRKRAYDDDLLTRLASYESLMRQHGVDFSKQSLTWDTPRSESSFSKVQEHVQASESGSLLPEPSLPPTIQEEETLPCLWSTLSPELKHLPIISLRHRDDPFNLPMPSLQSIFENAEPIHTLHPDPRTINRLWHIFIEAVNPLTKIIHVPTLQQRILDASFHPAEAPPVLTALMFSIYTCAVTSLPSSGRACETLLGESRTSALTKYRIASLRALTAIDFLTNRHLESLQAFCLFLFSSPESDLSTTLIGAAVKLAQKSGLAAEDPSLPFFEREMRVRLWWQLRGIDGRSRAVSIPGSRVPMPSEMVGDLRLPLNVNDADLHPDMAGPPREHDGPTEMAAILIKYEMFRYFRAFPEHAEVLKGIMQRRAGAVPTRKEREAVDALEERFEERHLRRLDGTVPLHRVTAMMARLIIGRTRFALLHPKYLPALNGRGAHISRQQSDELFDAAVTTMEMVKQGIESPFSTHLIAHLTLSFLTEAVVYVVSELRERTSGERVETAWSLIEYVFTEYYEGLEACGEAFLAGLAPVAVDAWEAKQRYLDESGLGFGGEPEFVSVLRENILGDGSEAVFDPTVGFPGDVSEWWNNYLGF